MNHSKVSPSISGNIINKASTPHKIEDEKKSFIDINSAFIDKS